MVTRDFDAMLAEKAGIRPTFRVGGQEFTLRAKLPYAKWTRLLHAMRSEDVTPDDANDLFFRTVLVRDDRDRFLELLRKDDDDDEDDTVIGMQQMDELTDWIMAHFTGKPLTSSDGSSPGSNGTGPQQNVVSLTPKRGAKTG